MLSSIRRLTLVGGYSTALKFRSNLREALMKKQEAKCDVLSVLARSIQKPNVASQQGGEALA